MNKNYREITDEDFAKIFANRVTELKKVFSEEQAYLMIERLFLTAYIFLDRLSTYEDIEYECNKCPKFKIAVQGMIEYHEFHLNPSGEHDLVEVFGLKKIKKKIDEINNSG